LVSASTPMRYAGNYNEEVITNGAHRCRPNFNRRVHSSTFGGPQTLGEEPEVRIVLVLRISDGCFGGVEFASQHKCAAN
jgi:hypothetical protein